MSDKPVTEDKLAQVIREFGETLDRKFEERDAKIQKVLDERDVRIRKDLDERDAKYKKELDERDARIKKESDERIEKLVRELSTTFGEKMSKIMTEQTNRLLKSLDYYEKMTEKHETNFQNIKKSID